MLFLLFELGTGRYALDASQISEVLPVVAVRAVPQAPPEVTGVFNFRGTPVPVVDLNQVTMGRPSTPRLSTRIIVSRYVASDGGTRLLGLIAERVTDTVRRDPDDFVDSGINNPDAPYLGRVATTPGGMLQRLDISRLLTPAVSDMLFAPAVR